VVFCNLQVKDEYTFITDLSSTLAARYSRPESSILVTLNHSACLLFAGSFDPAYVLTITACPALLQPVTNMRNTLILQLALEESLSVEQDRGIIKFVHIDEENLAHNGRTVRGLMEDMDMEANGGMRRTLSRTSKTSKKASKRLSLKNLRSLSRSSKKEKEPESPRRMGFGSNVSQQDTRGGRETPPFDSDLDDAPTVPTSRREHPERGRSFVKGLFGRGN
jgi:hypothetical protein